MSESAFEYRVVKEYVSKIPTYSKMSRFDFRCVEFWSECDHKKK